MNKLIVASFLTLFSATLLANTYCYDDGVFAVSKYEESIASCKADFSIKSFENLKRSLMKGTAKQALRASGNLRIELDNATWSSNYSENEQKCFRASITQNQKNVDVEVLRSLELCL